MNRTLDRQGLREFENRILFQMSANDSSTLIDSPTGSKLGENRALYYSEEENRIEKFRPYGLPEAGWLDEVARRFAARPRPVVDGPTEVEAPRPEPAMPVAEAVTATDGNGAFSEAASLPVPVGEAVTSVGDSNGSSSDGHGDASLAESHESPARVE